MAFGERNKGEFLPGQRRTLLWWQYMVSCQEVLPQSIGRFHDHKKKDSDIRMAKAKQDEIHSNLMFLLTNSHTVRRSGHQSW